MKKFHLLIIAFIFFIGACSPQVVSTPGGPDLQLTRISGIKNIPKKILGALVDPIVDFTVADAQSTVNWIEAEIAAGKDWTKNPTTVAEARACPSAVLALNDLYTSLAKNQTSEDKSVKGLIYWSTVNKFSASNSIQEQGKALALRVATECGKLIPADKFAPLAAGL